MKTRNIFQLCCESSREKPFLSFLCSSSLVGEVCWPVWEVNRRTSFNIMKTNAKRRSTNHATLQEKYMLIVLLPLYYKQFMTMLLKSSDGNCGAVPSQRRPMTRSVEIKKKQIRMWTETPTPTTPSTWRRYSDDSEHPHWRQIVVLSSIFGLAQGLSSRNTIKYANANMRPNQRT